MLHTLARGVGAVTESGDGDGEGARTSPRPCDPARCGRYGVEGVEAGRAVSYVVTLHDLHSVVDVTGDGGVLVKRLNVGQQAGPESLGETRGRRTRVHDSDEGTGRRSRIRDLQP